MHRILNYRVQKFVLFILQSAFMMLMGSCASPTIVTQPIIPVPDNQRIEGSVNVQTEVIEIDSKKVDISNLVNSDKFKDVLEKTISQNGLFSRISQGNADYVLDVWVEKIDVDVQYFGEGWVYNMTSIWRLTRVKDRNVLACDFVHGHGASRGGNFTLVAMDFATSDTIQKGLLMLADRSTDHMSAMPTAGARASKGPIIALSEELVKQNWSKLHMGLTLDEVEKLIGLLRGSYTTPQKNSSTQVYRTNLCTLVFINGKLSRWELQDH
jgi:hypothetical protein